MNSLDLCKWDVVRSCKERQNYLKMMTEVLLTLIEDE